MDISELQDIGLNKPCFIIASGPSIHTQDIAALDSNNVVTIAINAGIVKAPFSDYFLSDDNDVQHWSYFWKILPKNESTLLLYKDKPWLDIDNIDKKRIVWFSHKTYYDNIQDKYYEDGLVLTKDASLPIIGARNSAGSAIHFAYIMGCSPIVLLGCDCCFVEGKKYFWQFKGESSVYKRKGKVPALTFPLSHVVKYNGHMVDRCFLEFIRYWEDLSKQCERQNIKVINASGGALDAFESQDYNDVIQNILKK